MIQTLSEEDGEGTTDQWRMVKCCAESYQAVYEDQTQSVRTLALAEQRTSHSNAADEESSEHVTSVKSPGGDQVPIEMIKVGGDVTLEEILATKR